MPNRGQVNDQNRQKQDQKNLQNPGTFSPDDDEAQEADRTQLAQDVRSRKRRGTGRMDEQQPNIEQEDEEAEDDEDDEEPIGR